MDMKYSRLRKNKKWTQKESLQMLIYITDKLEMIPSEVAISKAKESLKSK